MSDELLSLDEGSRKAFADREAKLRDSPDWPVTRWYTDEDFCRAYHTAMRWHDHAQKIRARVQQLESLARVALDFYDIAWQIGGSPLDLAVVFGDTFTPPGPEELEKKAAVLRDALLAAGYGRKIEKKASNDV